VFLWEESELTVNGPPTIFGIRTNDT